MLSKQKIKQKVNQWTPGDEGEGKERCIIKQHERIWQMLDMFIALTMMVVSQGLQM